MSGTLVRSAALGAAAGVRSMTPITIVSWAAASRRISLQTPLDALGERWVLRMLALWALGEYAADKLPFIPSRTAPPFLAWRAVMGGLVGAAISAADRESSLAGSVVGISGAVAGSFGGEWARMRVSKNFQLPGPLAGTLGDLVGIGLSFWGVRR